MSQNWIKDFISEKMKGRLVDTNEKIEIDRFFNCDNHIILFKQDCFACFELFPDCYYLTFFYADKKLPAYRLYREFMLRFQDKPIYFRTKMSFLFKNHAINVYEDIYILKEA